MKKIIIAFIIAYILLQLFNQRAHAITVTVHSCEEEKKNMYDSLDKNSYMSITQSGVKVFFIQREITCVRGYTYERNGEIGVVFVNGIDMEILIHESVHLSELQMGRFDSEALAYGTTRNVYEILNSLK
jgi:hypothetical protein